MGIWVGVGVGEVEPRPVTPSLWREDRAERHDIEVYKVDLPAAARFAELLARHLGDKPPVGEAGPDEIARRDR
jgi:hypothetical protein